MNEEQLDQVLEAEWKRSLRYQHPISLLLTDIDFFKRYNDHHGHTRGDECLKRVAEAISFSLVRSEDLAARYGGEEFACVLPETGNEGGLAVATRVLERVRALEISHEDYAAASQVTICIGLATCVPAVGEAARVLVDAADQALYRAKEQGRNRVVNRKDLDP